MTGDTMVANKPFPRSPKPYRQDTSQAPRPGGRYLSLPEQTPEGAERLRQQLIAQGIIQASDREYGFNERGYQERPCMPDWMLAKLKERLVKSGVLKLGAGFQKLIDQGVLCPSSVYGKPKYLPYSRYQPPVEQQGCVIEED